MNIKTLTAAFAAVVVCGSLTATAETITWTNVTSKTSLWSTKANWTNATGAIVAVAPTNGEDIAMTSLPVVSLSSGSEPDSTFRGAQTLSTGVSKKGANTDPIVGTITGEDRRTIKIDTITGYSGSVYFNDVSKLSDGTYGRFFDVTNPNGFLGFWQALGVLDRIYTHPSDSFTPVFHNFYVGQRPIFDVPAGRVEIENAYGGNTFEKKGTGTLAVKSFNNFPTRVILKGGTLELCGQDADALETLLAKAALHLDASKTSTLTQYAADEGTRVSQWCDVRGGPDAGYMYAGDAQYKNSSEHYLTSSTNPIYRADTPSAGLALLDFGNVVGKASTRPGECLKIYPQKLSNVRAAFYAADCPNGAGSVCVLGDVNSFHYIPSGDTALYDSTYSASAVRYADITLNMRKVSYGGDGDITRDELTALHVVGQDTNGKDTKVGLLGSREYYRHTSGGSRIGEVILFTNDLTRAERMLVAAYLNGKWRKSAGSTLKADLDAVLATTAANLAVPAGKTAKIDTVNTEKSSIVKSGEGRLEIGTVVPAATTYTVNAGELAFTQPTVTTDKPADGAYLWLDATKLSGELVNEWPDARSDVELKGTTGWTDEGHVPRLITSDLVGGKQVVDFGGYNNSGSGYVAGQEAAWMTLPAYSKSSYAATYTYFCVMRVSPKSARSDSWAVYAGMQFIGSNDMLGYHDSAPIVSANYRSVAAQSMQWHINGTDVDPFTYGSELYTSETATNGFRVISFSSAIPLKIDRLCSERDGSSLKWRKGGKEIGEVLLYSRQLTADEMRNTEAYLMAKWLGKEHPAQKALSPATMTFGEDVAASIETDADMTIGTVKGGNGALVKAGSGVVTASAVNVSPTDITVTEGGITIPLNYATTFFDEAKFHLDASRLDTLTYTVDGAGNTNVTEWADIRTGSSFKATAVSDTLATAQPKLVTVEAVPGEGHYIQALDFGGYSWRTNDYYKLADTPSAAMKFSAGYTIKHAITVFADAHGAHQQSVLSSYYPNNNGHEFQRNWKNGQLYWADNTYGGVSIEGLKASSIARNATGGAQLDGKALSSGVYTAISSDRFHIFDFIAEQNRTKKLQTWTEDLWALAMTYGKVTANSGTSWGYDYDLTWEDRGGQYVAEQMGFDRMLTVEEQAYMKKYLNWKWFGGERPEFLVTNTLDSVTVAAGSSLTFAVARQNDEVACLRVKKLSGAGTIAVNALQLAESLDVTVANDKTDCLTVNCDVALDKAITVNVTADLAAGLIRFGQYPILTANSIEGFDGTTFTVNVLTPNSGIYDARVVKKGNTLYLSVAKRGLIMIFQ